ncbi:MAG: hypothetical protein QP807_11540 [Staphylococcus epidermidis]|nr:hypothetical protein [Staphylococcus epidermidis]MDK8322254.1 hypothetical protein [Staphylococcus epidermidis]
MNYWTEDYMVVSLTMHTLCHAYIIFVQLAVNSHYLRTNQSCSVLGRP